MNRQDVSDRVARDIPLTAFGMDDEQFDEVYESLRDHVDLRKTELTGTEYFVIGYDRDLQWLFDKFNVVGGDILFQRGPLPIGSPEGQLPPEWKLRKS